MRRRVWVGLVMTLVAAAGCGVDGYLTCGASCDDAGIDATTPDTGGGNDAGPQQDAFVKDAAPDVKDAGAPETGCGGSFCQGNGDCCGSAPDCNAGHRCATSCGAADASCSSQGTDTCCQPLFCNQGRCAKCFDAGVSCSEDWQCCGGACVGSKCN